MMDYFKVYLCLVIEILFAFLAVDGDSNFQRSVCHLLQEKFTASSPWSIYPIIYEPINKGRLTIWSGFSTLPTSEFKCNPKHNTSDQIVMDFTSFANKLEWTFFDINKGVTYNGVSVNHCEDVNYSISIENKRMDSYLDCNTVDKIELSTDSYLKPALQTTCLDCSHHLIALVNSQIGELIKQRLNDQVIDNLYWQLTQLLSNQHFSSPLPLKDNFDRI